VRPLRTYGVTALVLRIRNLGEADRIVTLLSAEKGKIAALAKGARRARSKLASLQLFSLATLQLASGRSFEIVTQSVIRLPFFNIREDMRRFTFASYFVELTDALSEVDAPSQNLFELAVSALSLLDSGTNPDVLVRGFELKILDLSGYAPQLDTCIVCRNPLGEEPMAFLPEQGGLICTKCVSGRRGMLNVHEETRQALLAIRNARNLPVWIAQTSTPSDFVQREMMHVLHTHTEYNLERPLKSLDMLKRLEQTP
jgi:DNA repair protein RecO (recombination protein O)